MHIPDGFIDLPTSVGAGVVALGALSIAFRKAGDVADDGRAPIAGLTAAFVFAAQMLNFPVASGTSGHLLGGVLAAVLLGPWLGSIVVAVVLVVQCLLFADGGLSAIGLNVLNMAVLPAWGGYILFAGIRRILPNAPSSVASSAAVTALLSVPVAAGAVTLEYAIGGNDAAPLLVVGASMVGVHLLIGIGEALITGLVVGAVLAVRPDLVFGARDLCADDDPAERGHASPARGVMS